MTGTRARHPRAPSRRPASGSLASRDAGPVDGRDRGRVPRIRRILCGTRYSIPSCDTNRSADLPPVAGLSGALLRDRQIVRERLEGGIDARCQIRRQDLPDFSRAVMGASGIARRRRGIERQYTSASNVTTESGALFSSLRRASCVRSPDSMSRRPGLASDINHLVGELLAHSASVRITHIAYLGAGPAVTALLGDESQLMIATLGSGLASCLRRSCGRSTGRSHSRCGHRICSAGSARWPSSPPRPRRRSSRATSGSTSKSGSVCCKVQASNCNEVPVAGVSPATRVRGDRGRWAKAVKAAGTRSEWWGPRQPQVTPSRRRRSRSAAGTSHNAPSSSSVCSPSRGGRTKSVGAVPTLTGQPMVENCPRPG